MAKKCMEAREYKRAKLVERYRTKREALKAVINSRTAEFEDKWQAQLELQKLPRNSSASRGQRRCILTGRPHGVYRKFGLGRNKLREHAMFGNIPGLRKASW